MLVGISGVFEINGSIFGVFSGLKTHANKNHIFGVFNVFLYYFSDDGG